MRLNSRLKRSRHGVYYYRAIVPVRLRQSFGCTEIKRSLNTKDPVLARLYAHYITLSIATDSQELATLLSLKQNCVPDSDSWRSLLDRFRNISTWVIRRPDGVSLEADPNNPKDLESAERLALKLFAEGGISPTSATVKADPIQGIKLSQVYPGWESRIRQEIPKAKTIDEYLAKFQVFNKQVGDLVVSDVTPKAVADFVTNLASGKVTGVALSPSSINKYLTAVNSFFLHAQREGAWPTDKPFPTYKQNIKSSSKSRQNSYKRFDLTDLKSIFDPANLLGWKKLAGRDSMPHMLWLPLIALHTGARIEELSQLGVTDVHQDEESIWVIDINDDDWKQVKTNAAVRMVPLHPELIELGFLDYVDDIRQHFPDERLLFPYLTGNKYDKLGDAPSKWFGRYLDKLDIKDPQKVFHSFRSTANDTLKKAGIAEETRCQMVGHEYGSVNSRNYTELHTPRWLLKNVIPKLVYSGLDLSGLKYTKGGYVDLVRKSLESKESKARHQASKAKR